MKKPLLSLSLLPALAALSLLPCSAEETGEVTAGEFTFTFAKPWEDISSGRPMRAAELKYTHSDEGLEAVEAVFYYFGEGQGGGIEPNIERWIGQFEGEPQVERETTEVDGRTIHYLYAKGTFLDSGMGGPFASKKTPKKDYMMLAAIVESDKGAVFVKATAPEKSALAAKDAFKKVVESPFAD